MKNRLVLSIHFLIFFIFTGCANINARMSLKVRVSAVSENGGNIMFKIFPENSDGNIVTGAVVTVTDESNAVSLCEFDNSTQSYTTSLEADSSSVFLVEVISNSDDEIRSIKIPHTSLVQKPVVEVFRDAGGNSVMLGMLLKSSEEIQVAWKDSGNNVVYNVAVKSTFRTEFSASTNACSVVIPANTLNPKENYTLCITAQKIYGDPFFRDENYYSVSSIVSSGVSFYAE